MPDTTSLSTVKTGLTGFLYWCLTDSLEPSRSDRLLKPSLNSCLTLMTLIFHNMEKFPRSLEKMMIHGEERDTSGLRYFCEKVESNDRQEKYIVRPPQPMLSFSLILTNLWIKTMYMLNLLLPKYFKNRLLEKLNFCELQLGLFTSCFFSCL